MKNFKRGFTMVEMLIVVVIIGILAAALLPRLQGAQAAARDSARKSDISQLGTAILSYQNNRGYYPLAETGGDAAAIGMIPASQVREDLNKVTDLSSLPADPLKATAFTGLDNSATLITGGQYGYAVLSKNNVDRAGFALMARTETEGGSNWVQTGQNWMSGDLTALTPCTKMLPASGDATNDGNGNCTYASKSQLRYIYVF